MREEEEEGGETQHPGSLIMDDPQHLGQSLIMGDQRLAQPTPPTQWRNDSLEIPIHTITGDELGRKIDGI